jgi:2',3'-cyclic-nucleotide 2'-phosphodiesterase (5'-nucleotidase family)
MRRNEMVEDNTSITDDAIGKEIVEAQVEQLNKEIKMFEESLVNIDKSIENYREQAEIDWRMYEIQLEGDNNQPLRPTKKYEEMEEFQELVKKKIEFAFRSRKYMDERKLEEYDRQKEQIQEQLDAAKEKLAEIVGDEE